MLLNTKPADIGTRATPFILSDPDGRSYSLEELMGENGLVVAFICNHCPFVQAIINRFVEDAETLKGEGVNTVAIMSNDYRGVPSDSPAMMKRFATQHGFGFPYLVDEDQSVARSYGAVCTPDLFGFNADYELKYRGRLDDVEFGASSDRTPEMLLAMREIAKLGDSSLEQIPGMGCSIKWK